MLTLNTLNCIIRLINWYLVLWTQAFYASNFHFFKRDFWRLSFFFLLCVNPKLATMVDIVVDLLYCCHWPHMTPHCQCLHPRGSGPGPPSGPSHTPLYRGLQQTVPHSSLDWVLTWSERTWGDGSGPRRIQPMEPLVWEKKVVGEESVSCTRHFCLR